MVGRNKISFFNDVKLRVLSKISNWQNKFFSSGRKEVLIKAIAQAVPCYAMSVFKIPNRLCDAMQQAVAKFWWGSKDNKRCIHWAKWERMCKEKIRGGMGFRDLVSFNQALIAKQAWRILQFPNSLMSKVLQARYFRTTDFLHAKLGSNPSLYMEEYLLGKTSHT